MKLSLSPELMVFWVCSNCSGRKMKDRMKLSLSPELMVFWVCSNQCSGRKMKDRMKLSLSPELMVFWVVFQPGWKIMGKIPPGSLCRRERERERERERPIFLHHFHRGPLSIGPTTQALGHAPKILKGAFSYTKNGSPCVEFCIWIIFLASLRFATIGPIYIYI